MSFRVNDRRGQPRAYDTGLFKTPYGQRGYRPRAYHTGDTHKLVSKWDWLQQVVLARQLFARMPVVHGAVCQKNLYAVGSGWRVSYTGRSPVGPEIEEYLNEIWYPSCDIRGEPYNFWLDLYLDACAIDRDGDELMICRKPEDLDDYTGPVRLQWVAAHRIADGKAKADPRGYVTVESGDFKGARICNGVIKDRNHTTIGYRVINDDDTQTDIPANAAQLLFEPDWNDLNRGLPRTAVSCLDNLDVEDINHFLKRQVKRDATLGITVHNERGGPMNPTQVIQSEEIPIEDRGDKGFTTQDVIVEQLVGNETEYFKSGTGGKVEALNTARPSPNVEAFVARIETQSLFSIGWFRQLMDPSTIGGAPVRAIQDGARHSVEWRQDLTIKRRAKRASIFAVADAMERGVISRIDDEKWWLKLAWTRPAQLTVDAGYDEKADLEQLANGTTTRGAVAGKKGRDWDSQVRPQNKREVEAIIEDAQAIAKEKKIPFELALNMLTKLPNNGTMSLDPEKEEKANETKPGK